MKKITIYVILILGLVGLFLLGYNTPKAQSYYERNYQEETVNQLEEANSNLKEMIGLLGRLNDSCRSCNK